MKTRLLLAGAVTAMASTALMADQVPDLLKFEVVYPINVLDRTFQIDELTTFTIDAAKNQLRVNGSKSPDDYYSIRMLGDPEMDNQMGLEKAYLTWRDSRKLPTVRFNYEATKNIGKNLNGIHTEWYPVADAVGYEIQALYTNFSGYTDNWEIISEPITVDAQTLSYDFNDLRYGQEVFLKIRALSPDGDEFNSDWCSRYTIAMHSSMECSTGERYPVPDVMTVLDRTETSFRVNLHLSYAESGDDANNNFAENFQIGADGNYVADKLRVIPASESSTIYPAPTASTEDGWRDYTITDTDRAAGYIDVTGLREGTQYLVTLINSNVPTEVDAEFYTIPVWTKTAQPETILIEHTKDLSSLTPGIGDVCLIDSILEEYMSDTTLPEGRIYQLEGGKEYCFSSMIRFTKGITLETRPEDVAAGLKATVYFGGIGMYADADGNTGEMSPVTSLTLGRSREYGEADKDLYIGDIAFRNIDFDCPSANNYGKSGETGNGVTGNYFFNMLSNSLGIRLDSLTFDGCSFRHFIRGFIRVQGGSHNKIFNKVTINGCLFSDCGYYNKNGNGYAWFASDGKQNDTNMFADLTFSNNTIYDSPMSAMFTDNNKELAFNPRVKWNIKVYNNTFFNFSTRTSGRYIFNMRYVPSGSHISFERNLIVQAAAEGDARPLYLAGADIRKVVASNSEPFTYTIKDNYSVASRAANQGDDRVFMSGAFSATKNSFGMFPEAALDCTSADLVMKQLTAEDGHAITPEELFNNPDPQYTQYDPEKGNSLDHAAPANIMEALSYKTLPAVITEKNIGDSRWR